MSVSDQREQSIKLKILEASLYWRENLPDATIRLYARQLSDLEPAEVAAALDELMADPSVARLPLPSLIRAKARPRLSVQDESRLIAARILEGIGRVGPYEVGKAKEFIGPAGWEVVNRLGGWLRVCEEVDYHNINQMQAQIRDLSASVLNSAQAGTLARAIELPTLTPRPRISGPQSTGDILKKALQNDPHEPGAEKVLSRSHEERGKGHQDR